MIYLLDTDTIIFFLRGNPSVASKIRNVGDSNIATTTINLAELYFGAFSSTEVEHNIQLVDAFRQETRVFAFDTAAAVAFGQVKADLKRRKIPLNDSDLLIAASALATNSVLVTNNVRHFKRIEGLRWENWVPQ
ncbi:MAG TPA: PIN domain-containing protein [Acidobacteriota bacterium]